MTSSLRRTATLALVVPALALTACGGDDKTSTTATTTAAAPAGLAQAALATKANAICKAANDKAKTVDLPQAADGAAAAATYFDALAAIAADQQQALAALTPANTVKVKWAAFLALNQEATDTVQDLPAAIRSSQAKAKVLTDKVGTLSTKINVAADALGATTCGSKAG